MSKIKTAPKTDAAPAQTDTTTEDEAASLRAKGFWEAADGSWTPGSRVKDVDKARDKVVRKLCAQALTQSAQLAEFKRLSLMEVQNFVDMSAADYGVVMRGAAAKGNVTLTTYDGRLKVEKAIQDRISFDERLQVAKAIFDEFVREQQKGSNDTVKVLLNHAFKVDRAGKVSVRSILDLRSANVDHPTWKRGLDAISDCMHTVGSATYLRFYRRNEQTGEYEPITLSSAAA